MSAFSGSQYKGAAKHRREIKRQEAEERNAKTPPERRKNPSAKRVTDVPAAAKLLTDIFTGPK